MQLVGVVRPLLEYVPAEHKLLTTSRTTWSKSTVQFPVHPPANFSANGTLLCPEYEAAENDTVLVDQVVGAADAIVKDPMTFELSSTSTTPPVGSQVVGAENSRIVAEVETLIPMLGGIVGIG